MVYRFGLLFIAILLVFIGRPVAAGEKQPTLDELLDITPSEANPQPQTDGQPDHQDVIPIEDQDSSETGQPVIDALDQAVVDMRTVSHRLGKQGDTGLTTQRLQESILSKLDQIIAAAKQQGGSSGSSGSSSSGSSGQAQQQETGSSGNAGQSSPSAGGGSPSSESSQGQQPSSGSSGRGTGDGSQQEVGPLKEGGSEWGHLPPRLRNELQQGLAEPFTPLYRSLTQQYYRRLAEEGQQDDTEP